jgi:valyl-tRNA synthetase
MDYSSHGRDISLDVLRVRGYRFFCNKIWQSCRFVLGQISKHSKSSEDFAAEEFKVAITLKTLFSSMILKFLRLTHLDTQNC